MCVYVALMPTTVRIYTFFPGESFLKMEPSIQMDSYQVLGWNNFTMGYLLQHVHCCMWPCRGSVVPCLLLSLCLFPFSLALWSPPSISNCLFDFVLLCLFVFSWRSTWELFIIICDMIWGGLGGILSLSLATAQNTPQENFSCFSPAWFEIVI